MGGQHRPIEGDNMQFFDIYRAFSAILADASPYGGSFQITITVFSCHFLKAGYVLHTDLMKVIYICLGSHNHVEPSWEITSVGGLLCC